MDIRELQHKQTKQTNVYSFNGIPIFCTTGIHEKIFEKFLKLKKNKNSRILVLGSGAGAFEKRLFDNGYGNLTSVEFVPDNFIFKESKLLTIDLNKDFSNIGKFDVIIAIELIEHLENQFHFIRCVKELMVDNSVLYLSTPNVENTFSRIKFFLVGRLHWFGVSELANTGHINPIFSHILKFNLDQSDLEIREHFANDNIWSKLIQRKGIKMKILYAISFFISLFMINKNNFEINLFEIVKKN